MNSTPKHAQTSFGVTITNAYLTAEQRAAVNRLPVEQRNAELAKFGNFSAEPLAPEDEKDLERLVRDLAVERAFAAEAAAGRIVQLMPPAIALQLDSSFFDNRGDIRAYRTPVVAIGLRSDGKLVPLGQGDLITRPCHTDSDGERIAVTDAEAADIDRSHERSRQRRASDEAEKRVAARTAERAKLAGFITPGAQNGAN